VRPPSILVAEDNVVNRRIAQLMLEHGPAGAFNALQQRVDGHGLDQVGASSASGVP